jgi:hypothetical protein
MELEERTCLVKNCKIKFKVLPSSTQRGCSRAHNAVYKWKNDTVVKKGPAKSTARLRKSIYECSTDGVDDA